MHNLLSAVWQAVRISQRGKQDINIHLLNPARFMSDSDYVIPPWLSDNVVREDYFSLTRSGDGFQQSWQNRSAPTFATS
jgi:hypothetical protein